MASTGNTRTRNELEQVPRAVRKVLGFLINDLPTWATWLVGLPSGYLNNGIGTTATVVSGGSGGYSSGTTTVTVPLPPTAPGGSQPAMITLTFSGGSITSATVTNQGSGYGNGTPPAVVITDTGSASGAVVTVGLANTDQLYNYTQIQSTLLVSLANNDYQNIGNLLSGMMQSDVSASAAAIHTAGTAYSLNDILTVTQPGCLPATTVQVTSETGGVPSAIAIVAGGFGAAVASNLSTTGGTGTGCTVNITAVIGATQSGQGYNFVPNTTAWAGWGF